MPAWVGLTNGISWELLSDKPDGVDRLPSTGRETEREREAAEKPSKPTMKNNATRRGCQMPAACGRGALNELVSECPKMPGSFFFFFCMKGQAWCGVVFVLQALNVALDLLQNLIKQK